MREPFAMRSRNVGFTLIEVLMALLIFGMIAATVQHTSSLYFSHYQRIENKTMATWIAENRLAELRLAEQFPGLGKETEEIRFGNEDWFTETVISATQEPLMRRVEVTVDLIGANDGQRRRQAVFEGYLGQH